MKNLSALTTAEITTPRENTILFCVMFIELPGQHYHADILFNMLRMFLLFTDKSFKPPFPHCYFPFPSSDLLLDYYCPQIHINIYAKNIWNKNLKKAKHLISIAFCKFNLTTTFLALFKICILSVNSKPIRLFYEEKKSELKQNTFLILKVLTTYIAKVGINYMPGTSYAITFPMMLSEHIRKEGYSSLLQSRLTKSENH